MAGWGYFVDQEYKKDMIFEINFGETFSKILPFGVVNQRSEKVIRTRRRSVKKSCLKPGKKVFVKINSIEYKNYFIPDYG